MRRGVRTQPIASHPQAQGTTRPDRSRKDVCPDSYEGSRLWYEVDPNDHPIQDRYHPVKMSARAVSLRHPWGCGSALFSSFDPAQRVGLPSR